MEKIKVIPSVKEYVIGLNYVNFNKVNFNEELTNFESELLSDFYDKDISYNLFFNLDESICEEAYIIDVLVDKIYIKYSNNNAKHNAILTLFQLLKNINKLIECHIYDKPDFNNRSIMIDISRNKVPSVDTLKKIINDVALVKINEIQLYVEGRSFYFESFPQFYEEKNDFLTGEDVLELTKYSKERNVDLIPNMNCFGHMGYWVNQEELKHLAIDKSFYWDVNGLRGYVTSINPELEESYDFLYKLFDDMLKYYPLAEKMTIGGDEPFELLFPNKKENADEIYQNHISKVINHVNSKGVTPWMWGDVVKLYPELLNKINAKFLEWGYEAGQFNDNNCSIYKKYNKEFVVCCGTSGWSSISGRMDNMIVNMKEAAYYGKKYNASGMMITDWNDGGSFSQLPTNLLSYVYGACYAWNYEDVNLSLINEYLDEFVFGNKISNSVFNLGRYVLCENNPKTTFTKLFTMLYCHQMGGLNFDISSYSDCSALFNRNELLNYEECLKMKDFLDDWKNSFTLDHDNQYSVEIYFSYRLLRHALDATIAYNKLRNIDCSVDTIINLINELEEIIKDYKNIWNYRNKKSDYYYSERRLKMLLFRYKHILSLMKGEF